MTLHRILGVSIGLPAKLTDLLAGSPFEPAVLDLVRASEEVLRDNKLPFFPAYTDHGDAHAQAVLDTAIRLIPEQVWDEELLEPADAAVLIGAILLHDLGLHIREHGFVELISEPSPLDPLPWFDTSRPDRVGDLAWPELWQAFRREARHFSQSTLDRLFGPDNVQLPAIAFGEADTRPEEWTTGDRLLVGEFLRRHHARLGHEIAMGGFPGSGGDFPVLGATLPQLADAIGVTARSHNEDLRQVTEYLKYRQHGDLRPEGAVLVYLMGLLRVADYFQIDRVRASPILLHLREPQSPQSVAEWRKHQAVERISWTNRDRMAVNIQVSADHQLRTHLQLAELIDKLQRELDVTNAVISETYGRSELAALALSKQRIRTNLFNRSLHERLSFVPRRARLRSAEDLFRLVVSDLYGNEPVVAGRELLQNAVDAVRELKRHTRQAAADATPTGPHDAPWDVLVEVRELNEERSELRVVDRGIGMTPSTIVDSFMAAGASFAETGEEDEAVDSATRIRWMKAGRFGVGVFAAFLLGPEVQVTTRHVESGRGIKFVARLDDDLVQLNWVDEIPSGTEIVVPFATPAMADHRPHRHSPVHGRDFLHEIATYYRLAEPKAAYRWKHHSGAITELDPTGHCPAPSPETSGRWRSVTTPEFDAVQWQLPLKSSFRSPWGEAQVVHNGIAIRRPFESHLANTYLWRGETALTSLRRPDVAVFDSGQRLKITLTRYGLAEPFLPFETELLRSIGDDVVDQALAGGGPARHPLAANWALAPVVQSERWFPLLPSLVDRCAEGDLCVLWTGRLVQDQREIQALNARFLDDQSIFDHWPGLGFRVALPAEDRGLESEERERFGLTQRGTQVSTVKLASWLGRKTVAGIHLRSTDSRLDGPGWSTGGREDVWEDAIVAEGIERFDLIDRTGASRELAEALGAIGLELFGELESSALALIVLRRDDLVDPPDDDPISGQWMSAIGGPLEYAENDRARREDDR